MDRIILELVSLVFGNYFKLLAEMGREQLGTNTNILCLVD